MNAFRFGALLDKILTEVGRFVPTPSGYVGTRDEGIVGWGRGGLLRYARNQLGRYVTGLSCKNNSKYYT